MKFHDTFVHRTPLLAFDEALNLDTLEQLLKQPKIREAIFLASPTLLKEYEKLKNTTIGADKKSQNVHLSLLKYALRLSSRATPFGLFASCGTGTWNKENNWTTINLNFSRHTRLDMHYWCALSEQLTQHPVLKPHLLFFPNNSIYTFHDKLRYVEYTYKGTRRSHQLTGVERNPYLELILEYCSEGAGYTDLITLLQKEAEVEKKEATAFLDELIETQLIKSELEPALTGPGFLDQLLQVLTTKTPHISDSWLQESIALLEEIKLNLEQVDHRLGNSTDAYHNIEHKLDSFNIPTNAGKLFQTNLHRNEKLSIPANAQTDLTEALHILHRLHTPSSPLFERFKSNFINRYGQQEVRLTEVLDVEAGIGFNSNSIAQDISPLLSGLRFPTRQREKPEAVNLHPVYQMLEEKVNGLAVGEREVVLRREDVALPPSCVLPPTCSAQVQCIKEDNASWHLQHVGGSSGWNNFSRFGHSNANVNKLCQTLKEIDNSLTGSEKITAEIVHLPEARTGNVLQHPAYLDYEIPYLTKSGVDTAHQITVQDLLLFYDFNAERFILKSDRLQKEILPRLSNAHHFGGNNQPLYQLLCFLQYQDFSPGYSFDWGHLKNNRFLPRVRIGQCIVQRATWRLNASDLSHIQHISPTNLKLELGKWRTAHNLPERFCIVEGDNELFINLNEPDHCLLFKEEVKSKKNIKLVEFLNPGGVRDDKNQTYVNEFILPLITEDTPLLPPIPDSPRSVEQKELKLSPPTPDTEWVYFKLYCGPKSANDIIQQLLLPAAELYEKRQWADRWFFIRYTDPEPHIRIRFHGTSQDSLLPLFEHFKNALQPYLQSRLIWKVQHETYEPEFKRYGKNTLLESEMLFQLDSQCTANFLGLIEGPQGEKLTWLFALKRVDTCLETFGLNLEQKKNLLSFLRDAYYTEFNMEKPVKLQLDKKYRTQRKSVEHMLTSNLEDQFPALQRLLNSTIQNMQFPVASILKKYREGTVEVAMEEFLASHLHMILNRMFRSKQREHELVCYDFLARHYTSISARKKKNQ